MIKRAYLSAVLDLYERNIVGFSFGRSNNNELVFATFEHALILHPNATPPLHSDRGYQYTGRALQKRMEQAGICQSMSRVGHWSNGGLRTQAQAMADEIVLAETIYN